MTGRIANVVPVDAGIIQDAARFKMDLVGGLKRTLHGEVKPSIYPHTNKISTQSSC